MNFKSVMIGGTECPNIECKEEIARQLERKLSKATVAWVAGIVLIPLLIGYGMIYSLITTADLKFAKEANVKVLETQFTYICSTIGELKGSMDKMNTKIDKIDDAVRQHMLMGGGGNRKSD